MWIAVLLEFRAQEGRDPDIDHVDTDADKLKATAVEVLKSLGVDQDWLDLSFTEYALLQFSVKVCYSFHQLWHVHSVMIRFSKYVTYNAQTCRWPFILYFLGFSLISWFCTGGFPTFICPRFFRYCHFWWKLCKIYYNKLMFNCWKPKSHRHAYRQDLSIFVTPFAGRYCTKTMFWTATKCYTSNKNKIDKSCIFPSVLWQCRLGNRKGTSPQGNEPNLESLLE